MVNVTVMCGLQGSGKTTIAQELQQQRPNCEIVSSDAIRKEFNYNIDNQKVFQHYYARAKELLRNGKNVILDATNVTLKARNQIFEQLKGIECEKTCYIVNTPTSICIRRLLERNQTDIQQEVPIDVLRKYEKNFCMPFYEEGWDDIIIHNVQRFKPNELKKALEAMDEYDQKNSHHAYTLGKHSRKLETYLKKTKMFPKGLGFLHDIGKMFTQTIGEDGEAHYYQHHCVGAYFVLSNTYLIENEDILDTLFYINYHMMPFSWQTDKATEKWKKIFGEDKFEKLKILNKGDMESSGTER